MSDKKRNTPLRTVQLSGRSQVIGQLVYISAKVRQVLLRLLQSGVKSVLKKIGHEPSGGQIVKSQNKRFYNAHLLDTFKQWESSQ